MSLLDAVRSALVEHPQILLQQQQVELDKGLLLQQTATFDTLLQASGTQARTYLPLTRLQQLEALETGITTNQQLTSQTNATVSASKLFRNGISVTPIIEASRTADNLTNIPGTSLSHFDIQVDVPLLQGRGRAVVAAQETAAGMEVGAALLDVNQTIAQTLATAASDYWNLVAALKSLEVATESEARGRSILDSTQTLVDADQVPRNDLNNVTANLADRISTRIAAEQAVAAARQQLAIGLGLSSSQILSMGDPTDDFPQPENRPLPADDTVAMQRYLDLSTSRRADLLAARQRVRESKALLPAARNALLPRLDLTLTMGYSGLREGRSIGDYLVSPFQNVRGEDVIGGVNFRFPVGNHLGKGEVVQTAASARQAELNEQNTLLTITAGVINAVTNLRESASRLASARESVEAFQRALAGEREKFTLGVNSVVDILTVEDRLTSAQLNQVQAQLSYALAIINFRFAIGMIVAPDTRVQTIAEDVFVRLPPNVVP